MVDEERPLIMGMHPCIWYTALIDYAEALLFISIFALCLLDLSSFLWQLLEFVARARHPFCQLRRHTVSSSFASLTSSSHTHFPASLRFHSTLSLSALARIQELVSLCDFTWNPLRGEQGRGG